MGFDQLGTSIRVARVYVTCGLDLGQLFREDAATIFWKLLLNLVGMSFCLGVRQAVSLICWALWPFGCQSDMYVGLCDHSAVSLI